MDNIDFLVFYVDFEELSHKREPSTCLLEKFLIVCYYLKKRSMYSFFHGSRFPGHRYSDEQWFLFKMSTKGPTSGVDLVNHMRRTWNGDLKTS